MEQAVPVTRVGFSATCVQAIMERGPVELALGLFGLDTFRGIGLIQMTRVCLWNSMRQIIIGRERMNCNRRKVDLVRCLIKLSGG